MKKVEKAVQAVRDAKDAAAESLTPAQYLAGQMSVDWDDAMAEADLAATSESAPANVGAARAGVQDATVVDGKIMSNADLIARAERAEAEYDAAVLANASPEDKDE